jgi:hypothetical protein
MRRLVAVLAVIVSVAAARAQTNDHLKCYKVHDVERLVGRVDLQSPQYGASQGCSIGKTALFCVPATETQAVVAERGSDFPRFPLPVSAAQAHRLP